MDVVGLTQRKNGATSANGSNNSSNGSGNGSHTTISVSSDNNNNKNTDNDVDDDGVAMTNRTTSNGTHDGVSSNGNSKSNGNGSYDIHTSTVGNGGSTSTSMKRPTAANSKGKSLKDRSQIPYSFYITFGTILSLQYFGGIYTTTTTTTTTMSRLSFIQSWYNSIIHSVVTMMELLEYSKNIIISPPPIFQSSSSNATTPSSSSSSSSSWSEYSIVLMIWLVVVLPLSYVFFVAPFRAGFWTGRKSSRHVFHRYMGLCYLIHYVLAWIEFFSSTTSTTTTTSTTMLSAVASSKTSYLCHIIAVMGVLQGSSAYFSFKVLPELNDPGYYSDKAVLSRTFVQENIFFTVMAVFGSIYYNEITRTTLRTTLGGRIVEAIYVFWPFVLVRPWYPITRFSNAGQTYNGRSVQNQYFYEVATMMVKFFYLWAKYFLGFFINFMVYLDLVKEENWPLINGMLLLNAGTVSLSIFLHTLRFKKVLPAKLTMSIYLGQIYLTFTAVPTILRMFQDHPKLCALCFAGLIGNATRNRKIHAVWCGIAMVLLTQTEIKW